MRRKAIRLVCVLFCTVLLATGCTPSEEEAPEPTPTPRVGDVVEKKEISSTALREDKSIYAQDENGLVTMWMTVRQGNAEDHTNHTWSEVNRYDTFFYSEYNIPRYSCEAILQVGDENGPVEGKFGYGETVPNATVMVRGQSSSKKERKNYKVRIKEGKGDYLGMRTIPLNKVLSDSLRFRNRLCFDLMEDVPQLTSIRTQFIHLYVKDETVEGDSEFEDYGLFVRLEQMNRTYLENHGLDSKGHLYKINVIFEWYAYEPLMVSEDDPDFDELAFSHHLEVKGNSDNEKLRRVLGKVNNYAIPIEDIVEEHFDVENISYYLAFQILDGNHDVGGRNMYIYSPLNSEHWYLLTWDCDGTFENTEKQIRGESTNESWNVGLTKYLGTVLFNRFLKVKEYREALIAAVEDLKQHCFTKERIQERVESFSKIVLPFVNQLPDSEFEKLTNEEYMQVANSLASEVEENYRKFYQSLEKPWPFFVGVPEITDDDRLLLHWDAAYDLDDEPITYECILATDPYFTNVLAQDKSLRVPEMICDVQLDPGRYFIRVRATNTSGYTQDCFDYYANTDEFGEKIYACKCVYLEEDGTFTAYTNFEVSGVAVEAPEDAPI